MLKELGGGITAIFASIIGLATLAVILSDKANTQGVISSIGSAFAGLIGAATGPITGATGTAGTAGYTVPSFASGYSTSGGGGGQIGLATNGFSLSVPSSVVSSGVSGLGSLFGGGGDLSGSGSAWDSSGGTSSDW